MHKDRLIELRTFSSNVGSKLKENLLSDELTQTTQNYQNQKYIQANEYIREINLTNQNLENMRKQYIKSTKPEKQNKIYHNVQSEVKKASSMMPKLQQLIKKINDEYVEQKKTGDQSNFAESKRIALNADASYRKFEEINKKISQQIKSTIKRQVTIIKGEEIEEQELTQIVKNPSKGQQMLQLKLSGQASVQLQNSVSDIIDKCNDLLKIQKSMQECLSMMDELSLLVVLQGQKIATIDEVIQKANTMVNTGEVKMQDAKELHKKSKKKMCCIMGLLLIAIGVVVIPIVISQT